MREVKFRALARLNTENNEWFYYTTATGYAIVGIGDGVQEWIVKDSQFTGLKDKNGKEIYEGDVVNCTHWFFDGNEVKEIYEGDVVNCTHWFFEGNEVEENFRASIGFRNGSFSLENIDSPYYANYTGYKKGEGFCWIGNINYCEEDYEVIGNIYENPELLENKRPQKRARG